MKTPALALAGLVLATGAAHAQPAEEPAGHADHAATPATPAEPAAAATPADPTTETAATPAEPAAPAEPATPAATVEVSDADIDNFAKATVKLREIQADTSLADDAKQSAMVAAVAEVNLDAAKYNAIGRAAQADATLRTKIQTAMSKYVSAPPSEG
jgi:hypothetical protein